LFPQHSHCVGTIEKYKDSTVVFEQGNFIFNQVNSEYWNTSILVKTAIKENLYP